MIDGAISPELAILLLSLLIIAVVLAYYLGKRRGVIDYHEAWRKSQARWIETIND